MLYLWPMTEVVGFQISKIQARIHVAILICGQTRIPSHAKTNKNNPGWLVNAMFHLKNTLWGIIITKDTGMRKGMVIK